MACDTCMNSRPPKQWSKCTGRSLIEEQFCFGKGYVEEKDFVCIRLVRCDKTNRYNVKLFTGSDEFIQSTNQDFWSKSEALKHVRLLMGTYNVGRWDKEKPVKEDGTTGNLERWTSLKRIRNELLGRVAWAWK